MLSRCPDLLAADFKNFFIRFFFTFSFSSFFLSFVSYFFPHPILLTFSFNDTSYIKSKKITVLVKIANDSNANSIIDELRSVFCYFFFFWFFSHLLLCARLCSEYVTDVSAITARHAITSIGQISGSVPSSMGHTLEKLLSFSELEIDYVTAGTLVAIRGTPWYFLLIYIISLS